jgi:hypothetical protein
MNYIGSNGRSGSTLRVPGYENEGPLPPRAAISPGPVPAHSTDGLLTGP